MTLNPDEESQVERLSALSTELVQLATLMIEAAAAKDGERYRHLAEEVDQLALEIAQVVPTKPELAPAAVARAAGMMAASIGMQHGFKASEGTLRLQTNTFLRDVLGEADDDH